MTSCPTAPPANVRAAWTPEFLPPHHINLGGGGATAHVAKGSRLGLVMFLGTDLFPKTLKNIYKKLVFFKIICP